VANPYRNMLLGLRLSSVGLWAVTTAAVLGVSISLLASVAAPHAYSIYYPSSRDTVILELVTGARHGCLVVLALGLLLGLVGRGRFLASPADRRVAHPRVLLATILEGSSLLSGTALLVLTQFGKGFVAGLPPLVEVTWVLFTGLAAYIARVQFHLYARSLAESFAPPLTAEVKAISRLYLYVPGGFVLALGVVAGGEFLGSKDRGSEFEAYGVVLGWLIATAATAFGLFMVWRWDGLLAGLRKAVILTHQQESETAEPDDPDAEYRRRYLAAHGTG